VSTLKATLATTENPTGGVVSVDLNALLYSFGFPMLVALILAARQPHVLRKIVLAYIVLAPFVTWGLIAEFLKRVTFDIAPSAAAQAGFGPLQREAIAFAYQFGALILPTVAPAVFWVLTHRRFLENFATGEASAGKPSR
jgi:glucan phosphoethanolaminetransferase (alkaline phosphatase superfamily)